ncbi:MAG: ferredoxin [Actinobacteria bacterium]|nr:MAG: ferredoxin [Actinomycetota bacterium]
MKVWIDQDLCTGDGLCTDHCPEVFVLLEDGISYVRHGDFIGNARLSG